MSEQKDLERAAFEAGINPHCRRRNEHGDYVIPEIQDRWNGWQARASLPAGVPDGWKLVPLEPTDHMMRVARGMSMQEEQCIGCEYRKLVNAAPAAPTVKAEQVDVCDTCHGQAEVYSGHDQHFHYFDFQPPEPIMEVCPECGGEEAPSMPAAGLADLTAVRCQCCSTEYPHDSYDAGFIAGSGMCQVCDAAIPAVDLPSAAPAEQPYPHGIAEDLERSDWAPLEALQWYAAGKHFDVADGRTRIIDTGAVASNALKHASLAYLELKGDAELSELRAALSAQQSAHVSVPRELLERVATHLEWDGDESQTVIQYANKCDALAAELRALLNGGEA